MILISLVASAKLSTSAAVGPIQKVIQLVDELIGEVMKEGDEGAAAYEEFTDWCKEQAIDTRHSIDNANEQIEQLTAAIDVATALIAKLKTEIGGEGALEPGLTGKISAAEKELAEATKIRDEESAGFKTSDKDLEETVDMVTRAHAVLEKNLKSLNTALVQESLTQLTSVLGRVVESSTMRLHGKLGGLVEKMQSSDVLSLLTEGPETGDASGAVMSQLQELLDTAEESRAQGQKEEMTAQHDFNMFEQSQKSQVAGLKAQLDTAKKRLNLNSEKQATADGGLITVKKELSETQTYRSDTQQKCMERAADWEKDSAERNEEVNTLTQAKKILLNQGKPPGVSLAQTGFVSFVQVAARRSRADPGAYSRQLKAAEFLRKEASKTGSWVLAQVSDHVAADPFGKVKQMVQAMIEKLTEEQAGEAEHKAWCDEEMAKSTKSHSLKKARVESLQIRLEKGQADTTKLSEETQNLVDALGALDRSLQEAMKMRQEESGIWSKAKKEHETGEAACAAAIKVLRQYYEGKSFVQEGAAARVGVKGPQGIIGLLEVAEADFSRALAEGQAAEDGAVEEFEKLSEDARVQRATMMQDVKNKKAEKSRVESLIAETQEDLVDAQKELSAVVEYLGKVKSSCETKTPSHEERQARRAKEIEGLQTALGVLDGTDVGFLQK